MAVISPASDELATKELLKSKGDELIFHTANESIVLENGAILEEGLALFLLNV